MHLSIQHSGGSTAICGPTALHLRIRRGNAFHHWHSRGKAALESGTCSGGSAVQYISGSGTVLSRQAYSGECVSCAGCALSMAAWEAALMNSIPARRPYQGLVQILQFNWRSYFGAAMGVGVAILALPFLHPIWRVALLLAATPA